MTWDQFAPWDTTATAQRAAAAETARRAGRLPAYFQAWSQAGIDPDQVDRVEWTRIPPLTKEELIEAAAAQPPFGGRLGAPQDDLAHVFVAPGPLYMPFTRADMRAVASSFAKAFASCGLERGDLVDQTTMYNWVIAATAIDRALDMVGCTVIPGGVGQTERHIETIRRLGVTAIVAFPTFLEHLLELAAADGGPLPLRKAVVMGELSHPDAKARLRARHGVEAREFYGVADVGAVAWECSAGNGMHLRDDLLVEFLRPGGDEAARPAPGSPAELVVTDLARQAMPIVRLRTGDLVDGISHGRCACGRCSPRVGRIVGRASEITKVKGMFVVPRQVDDVLRMKGVERRFRLIVDRADGGRDRLGLEIEGDGLAIAGEELRAEVEKALRLRVELSFVRSLPEGGPRLVDRRSEATA